MSASVQYIKAKEDVDASAMPKINQKVCLICIDGWGVSPDVPAGMSKEAAMETNLMKGDAIRIAKTPVMDALCKESHYSSLSAHGLSVGLPADLMGNSEVGHLNIGAGRVVYQDIVRIDLAVNTPGALAALPTIDSLFRYAAEDSSRRLHFLGLVSDGGVHSHQNHLYALLRAAKASGVKNCSIHCFTDGRDTAPMSAKGYLEQLQSVIEAEKYGEIASVCGRYYAMDRDNRAERIAVALQMLLHANGEITNSLLDTVQSRYDAKETDEFLRPIIVNPEACAIREGDAMFFFNYRSDRMRQITAAFLPKNIPSLPVATEGAHRAATVMPKSFNIATMTVYKGDYPYPVAFPPQTMDMVLAEALKTNNVPQSHIAETEKYAHVTFFFNGGREEAFAGEDRVLVPSPKVATYDLLPQMSAAAVGDEVARAVALNRYPFVMCNFAPPDMVGHTGKLEAAIQGVAATDKAIGVIVEACKKNNYTLIVTADHGNAEKMLSENGEPHTAHTCARVPLCVSPFPNGLKTTEKSALCDVAPTVLKLMGLSIPKEMTGTPLL